MPLEVEEVPHRTRVLTEALLRLESLGGIQTFLGPRAASTMDMVAMAAMVVALVALAEVEDSCRKVNQGFTPPEVGLRLRKVEQGELRITTQET